MSQRKKVIIAVVAVVAALGGYWKLALSPKRAEAARLSRDIAAKEAEVRDAQATLAPYEQARRSYQANYATLLRLGKAVPEDDDTPSLMVQLDAAARRSGVDFRTVTVGGDTGAGTGTGTDASSTAAKGTTPPPGAVSVGTAGFSVMPFTFSFRGDFFQLAGFFARLQRFVTTHNAKMSVTGRLLRLDAISLKPDATGFPRLRAAVTASSYLLPATQGLTAGGSPAGPGTQTAGAGASGSSPASASPATTTATIAGATR